MDLQIASRPTVLTAAPSGLTRWLRGVFTLSLAGNALAAYSIGRLPVPWLAECIPLAFVLYQIARSQRMLRIPGFLSIGLFFLWALWVTVASGLVFDYDWLLPSLATTSYTGYVGLRFLHLLAAIAHLYVTYQLVAFGHGELVRRTVVLMGALAAVAALYIYLAQTAELWEPPRTRLGTSGQAQALTFTYAFHRAMGTFREPSHLAEWLVVPLFLSIQPFRVASFGTTVLLGAALFLTGSLTGILGALLGLLLATALLSPLRAAVLRTGVCVVAVTAVSYAIFSWLVVSNGNGHTNLLRTVRERIEPMVFGSGLLDTNRVDVYLYLSDVSVPVFGWGLGNANLLFTHYLGTDALASLLSLYYNTLYSTGYVGLTLLGLFLLKPVVRARCRALNMLSERALMILAAYCSWLAIFAVQSEELTIMFMTIYALTCGPAGEGRRTQDMGRRETEGGPSEGGKERPRDGEIEG